jgi:hypothetical protein
LLFLDLLGETLCDFDLLSFVLSGEILRDLLVAPPTAAVAMAVD